MQGLYQVNRLSGLSAMPPSDASGRRFYRLWVVEDHQDWRAGPDNQPLELAGTLWFFPKYFKPGIPYREVEGFAFWFDDVFLGSNPLLSSAMATAPWTTNQPFLLAEADTFQVIYNLCRDHQSYLSGAHQRPHALAYATATLLLLHLLEASTALSPPPLVKREGDRMDGLLSLIERHYTEQHQPQFYARAMHMTLANLRRLCRDNYGQTPMELIRHRLLEEARRLLLESDQSVKEIAYTLGFEDESYFVRFFRRQTLLPPRAYRRSFLPSR